MFGGSRRHRAPAPPLTRETANPNAATAAASAFMRREAHTPSLSSAAAAAALRARPTTPTNVAEVQSKRAIRRSASMSSTAGRGRGAPRPEIRRAPSNASMTERTFRTPSPSPSRGPAPRREAVPPVPSLPQTDQLRGRVPSHKKSSSLQTQPFRTASQKMKDGDGTWFGAAAIHDPSNVRTSDAIMHQRVSLDDRSGSISPSVNFSYPRGILESPAGSQPRSSVLSDHTLVYDANSRRMVPQGELYARQQAMQDQQQVLVTASEKPVKKKKQDISRSGSHLAKGTVARTRSVQNEPQPAPVPTITLEPTREPVVASATGSDPSATATDATLEHTNDEPDSIQPEDVAVDELELRHHQDNVNVAPGPEVNGSVAAESDEDIQKQRQVALETLEKPRDEPALVPAPPVTPSSEPPKSTRLVSPPPRRRESVSVSPAPIESTQDSTVRRTRVHSESPARTARFATASDQLVVKHEPPPRSLSPRKSALKHSSSRPISPSDDSSEASGPRPALLKEDSVSRKKSVRVSFNDKDTVVVGEAAEPQPPGSPVIPSPQVKKSWTSLIGRHKRDTIALDEDETMTPRPALPAFGSVREKKPRELDERPLVRPSERMRSPPAARNFNNSDIGTAVSPEPAETDAGELGASNDHAVGAIFAQDNASRNEANTSKYREPLPPVVTSVEHSGYISNSPMSSDDEDDLAPALESEQDSQELTQATEEYTPESTQELDPSRPEPGITKSTAPTHAVSPVDRQSVEHQAVDEKEAVLQPYPDNVPTISVSRATPTAKDEEEESRGEYFGVPGGFPEDEASESSPQDFQTPQHDGPGALPSVIEKATPAPITPVKSHEVQPSTPSPQMDKIKEEKESSDESEVFSDAYEDLSEVEGDGFLSLDAVLTTPVKSKMTQKLIEQSLAQQQKSKSDSRSAVKLPQETTNPKTADEWEQAKTYWKSLTADKRRQLELEAMEEAGEEADYEGTQKSKKAKKRRSMDKSSLEMQRHPDRTYQIEPGTQWAQGGDPKQSKEPTVRQASGLKKPAGGEAPAAAESGRSTGGSLRKSMRSSEGSSNSTRRSMQEGSGAVSNAAGLGMRKSMRSNDDGVTQRPNGQAGRPTSYNPAPTTNHSKLHKRTQSYDESPQIVVPGAASMKPTLRRRGSDSSESSFRRARPGNAAGGGGGFGFRSTMRGSMRETQRPAAHEVPNRSSRFSLRSLSPTPFRRASTASPPPPSMGNRMRPSMRSGDSSDGSTSRLRIFGRTGSKKPARPATKASRFGDSSDEEDVRPAFSSRFADSSDEEDVPSSRPVGRGMVKTMRSNQPAPSLPTIHRGPIRSDSPDLPDSDDELLQPKRGATTAPPRSVVSLHRSGSGRGSLATPVAATTPGTIQARPSHQRRGSFMSTIMRRKKDPGSKISRDVSESAARRDTALERSTEQLAIMRSNSGGRLQKKGPNWPFPDGDHDANDARPATATASIASPPPGRPAMLQRRTMSTQVAPTALDGSVADYPLGPQKKKKFGALRKMFGIHD